MFARYRIIEEVATAKALAKADEWLSTQPKTRNVEEGQFGDNQAVGETEVLPLQQKVAEAGGNRTHRCGD